jgi:tight adherence protein B
MNAYVGPLVFLASLTTILAVSGRVRGAKLRSRLVAYHASTKQPETNSEAQAKLKSITGADRLSLLAVRAGVSVQVLVLFIILFSFLGAMIASSFMRIPILAPFGMLAGAYAPKFLATQAVNKRMYLIGEQSDVALSIMSNALRAGASFSQAIERAAEESPHPISEVFFDTAAMMGFGVSPPDAMLAQAKKVGNQDLAIMAITAQVQSLTGGNIAHAMDTISDLVRERRIQFRTLRALTAQGRLSGTIITGIPFGVIALVYAVSPGYFAPMTASTGGWIAITMSFLLIAIGWVIIKRLTTFTDD